MIKQKKKMLLNIKSYAGMQDLGHLWVLKNMETHKRVDYVADIMENSLIRSPFLSSGLGAFPSQCSSRLTFNHFFRLLVFPGGSGVKNLPAMQKAHTGAWTLIPGSGRAPGEGNGNPLQYSCLKIPWPEKPGRLQSMRSQKSQPQLNN